MTEHYLVDRLFPEPTEQLVPSVGHLAIRDSARRAHDIWLENNSMPRQPQEIQDDWGNGDLEMPEAVIEPDEDRLTRLFGTQEEIDKAAQKDREQLERYQNSSASMTSNIQQLPLTISSVIVIELDSEGHTGL